MVLKTLAVTLGVVMVLGTISDAAARWAEGVGGDPAIGGYVFWLGGFFIAGSIVIYKCFSYAIRRVVSDHEQRQADLREERELRRRLLEQTEGRQRSARDDEVHP